jgi:BNR repeat-like domain
MPRRHRAPVSLGLALATLAVAVPIAFAATVGGAIDASPHPSPFAACTVGATATGTNFPNTEVEPWIAVNPTNASNLIGVFQQDRWDDGGAHGLVAAVSTDGGASWSHSWAHFSTCAGGTSANGGAWDRASDPWVSFGPDGRAYQISLSIAADESASGILASTSSDGGLTWAEPATIIAEGAASGNFNDKESITADPTHPGVAYAVWDRSRKPGNTQGAGLENSFAFRGDAMFSKTTDGGATWSAPLRMTTNANQFTIGNQIVVLPDGTLVDFTDLGVGSGVQPSNQDYKVVMRSTDGGTTWSKPIRIAENDEVQTRIPDATPSFNGHPFNVRAGGDDIAVAPDGSLYAVWTDSRFSGGVHNDIAFTKSTDGGLTWSAPIKANGTPASANVSAFTPSVDVNADGDVAVSYYDFRNNTPDPGVPTDAFVNISSDGGATWSESRLTAASFDITTAPVAPASRGFFLGDYEGLTHAGSIFSTFFAVTTGDPTNLTDVELVKVTP